MRSLVQENISEIMNPYLITVSPYDTLAQAYEILVKNKIRRLPVVNGNKKLIGILTLKDILETKPSDIKHTLYIDDIYKHLSALTVAAAMTNNPITVYQSSTVGNAAEPVLECKIGGLPVLDAGGNLVGVVTESDIFRLIVRRWRDENYLKSAVS
ncbi:MAG: CBS domain-containing protein [Gammaproteobacteria bacterium]